jgi:hypothetical protein
MSIKEDDRIFPDIEGLEHHLDDWYALGLASSNGMGQAPLSFQDIEAYSRLTQSNIDVMIIRKMSNAYCSGLNSGSDKAAFPPYPRVKDRSDVDSKLRNALNFLKKPDRQQAKIR